MTGHRLRFDPFLALALPVFVLVLTTAAGWGATRVEYSAPNGLRFFADAAGTAIPIGNAVRLGYFNGGFDPATSANDLAALGSAWQEYGATTMGTNVGLAGHFDVFAERSDASFNGRKAYLWVFQTADDGAPAADFSNVTAYGLFSGSAWQFPTLGSLPTQATLTVNTGSTSKGVTEVLHGVIEADRLRLQSVGSAGALSFAQWSVDPTVFDAGTSAEDRAVSANPDRDELTNGQEFYHGFRPLVSEGSPLGGAIVEDGGTTYFDITFPRRKGVTGATHRVESTTDLGPPQNWQTVTPQSETVADDVDDPQRETVTIRILIAGTPRQFVRLVLEITE